MPRTDDARRIGEAAQDLLARGSVGDAPLRQLGTVGSALPVRAPDGALHSWFVPVTVGDRLAALFQILPNGTLMRFSAFHRRLGAFDQCPAVADWLDHDRIRAVAAVQKRPDETSGVPYLTYDRTPDRLVWAVPLTHVRGDVRLLYVAGDTVYAPPPGGTFG